MRIAPAKASWRGYGRVGLLVPLLLAACKDSGLPGRNTPSSQAALQQSRYPVYEAGAATGGAGAGGFVLGGQTWVRAGTRETIPLRLLKPVGNAQGAEIYALSWDGAPYTRLYMRAEDGSSWPLSRS
jgi:hypothetical protein